MPTRSHRPSEQKLVAAAKFRLINLLTVFAEIKTESGLDEQAEEANR